MFGMFKKDIKIYAPVTGSCVDLSEVPDEVFSEKMIGDGVALRPTENLFVAPAGGELTMLFPTGHAFGMRIDKTIEILIHIGIDTVELNGEGFEILAEQGQFVKTGTPIVRVDLEKIRQRGYDLITPVILTSPAEAVIKPLTGRNAVAARDVIFSITP